MSAGKKRTLLIAAGTAFGAFFLYLAFRDISWSELVHGVGQMRLVYLLPCAVVMIMIQLARAVRFGLILKPFCLLTTKQLWDLLNIWAASTMFLPARLGELTRPYLLKRRGVSFSSAFGAVIVERFFDLSGLLLLLALVLWYTPEVPASYAMVGKILLVVLVLGYGAVLLILSNRERVHAFSDRLQKRFPGRVTLFITGTALRLIDGLGIMASLRQAVIIFLCSVAIWVLFSLLTYFFLVAFSVREASFLVAVTIQVFLCLGVALPSAPGFVGTFHAAGRYALALFGIQSVVAVSFATAYHLFSLAGSLVLGFVSYFTSDFRLDQAMLAEEDSPDAATVPDAPVIGRNPGSERDVGKDTPC
jgi:glycosyltransferase 2 family protein